ncbi:MAG TPA: heavy metal-responsive transcriptional regulator [Coleofasciculaceae cyanobacterium]
MSAKIKKINADEHADNVAGSQCLLKIGEVRSQSGCSIQTIRYYESLGLIRSTDRTTGGFRLFAPTTLDRLAFIKQAQALGMSLQDISELLTVYDSGHAPCSTVKCKLRDKLADLDQRIHALERLRHELQSLLAVADDLERSPGTICPIVERANQRSPGFPVEP